MRTCVDILTACNASSCLLFTSLAVAMHTVAPSQWPFQIFLRCIAAGYACRLSIRRVQAERLIGAPCVWRVQGRRHDGERQRTRARRRTGQAPGARRLCRRARGGRECAGAPMQ